LAHSARAAARAADTEGMAGTAMCVEVDILCEGLWADVQSESSQRLLMAGLEAFAMYGFAGSTTRQITERAGMSPAGLYVHYRSKADLLFEITRTGHERALAEVTTATERALDAPAKLRAFVETFVIWHARFHTLARVCQYELRSLGGEQLEAITRLRRAFQRQVEGILQGAPCMIVGDVSARSCTEPPNTEPIINLLSEVRAQTGVSLRFTTRNRRLIRAVGGDEHPRSGRSGRALGFHSANALIGGGGGAILILADLAHHSHDDLSTHTTRGNVRRHGTWNAFPD
jgi:AcrR family transcriptional regulator